MVARLVSEWKQEHAAVRPTISRMLKLASPIRIRGWKRWPKGLACSNQVLQDAHHQGVPDSSFYTPSGQPGQGRK